MATVRLVPLNEEFVAPEGESIMGAAQALGYYWPTTCGGEGRCTTCACEVLEGGLLLEEMGRSEQATLVEERGPAVVGSAIRLACQARVTGEGTMLIRKPGVRRPD